VLVLVLRHRRLLLLGPARQQLQRQGQRRRQQLGRTALSL
jgi:hypothetical protein